MRELKNVVERVLLLEAEDEIRIEHLPSELTGRARGGAEPDSFDAFPAASVRPLAELERMAIVHALRVCDGNKTRAALQLGISRQTLRTKLKDYQMGDDTDPGADEAADQ